VPRSDRENRTDKKDCKRIKISLASQIGYVIFKYKIKTQIKIKVMTRSELIAAAKAAGIKNASRTSSTELETALANVGKAKVSTGKRGRPVVEGSARQLREAAKAARAAANGGVVKRGRPAQPKVEVTEPAQEDQVG
jgi:hypothetical protein